MDDRHTADGDPLEDRGTADSAIDRGKRADELQGDDDFEKTDAEGDKLLKPKPQ